MNEAVRAVGIMGGTFDPVHFGHLRSAVECATAFGLSEVRLMPCNPVHRHVPVASAEDRQQMLELAVEGSAQLVFDGRELFQSQPTFTIDTLRQIRLETGYARPLYFIVGSDAFNAIETWKDWQCLFAEANFIVMHRPSSPLMISHPLLKEKLSEFHGEHLPYGCIYPVQVSGMDISSTKIRQLCAAGKSIEFLLPAAVEKHIQQKRLYR